MKIVLLKDNLQRSRPRWWAVNTVKGLRRVIACIALTATFASLASTIFAADMPMPVKAPQPPIVWSWTEFYFGVHIGYAQANTSWCTDVFAVTCAGAATDSVTQTPKGFAAGGQFGYRWQATDNIVIGAEYMLDGMAINLTSPSRVDPNGLRYSAFNNLQSITGQLGFAFDRALLYGKGGWADTRVNFDAQDTVTGVDLSTPSWKWVNGWTAGGGLEYMLWTHLSIGVEYDYYRFNISNYTNLATNTGAVVGCAFCNMNRSNVQTVLARLNVKLWPWGP
jgi:outer membrane immunogenic protein